MQSKSHKQLKILMSVYSCRPNQGSEPGVGWNTVKGIGKHHQVWAITRHDNQPDIEVELKQKPLPNVTFIYHSVPFWNKKNFGDRITHIHYYMWHLTAIRKIQKLHQEIKADIGHHVTHVKYWSPNFLSFLQLPFLWGAVGGGESAPWSFYKTFSKDGVLYEYQRTLIRKMAHFDPLLLYSARKATMSLATTEQTANAMRLLGTPDPIQIMPAIAISSDELNYLKAIPIKDENPFRLVSIGRLLDWKGFHLGLHAFANLLKIVPNSEYWIIGNGPQESFLRNLAQELGIVDKVHFLEQIPREKVLENLSKCDVLVHPSLHESGGFVCLEAMAAGRPVICLDIGGPALQVTDETGFKISSEHPEKTIHEISEAMKQLATNTALRHQMGVAGRQRIVSEFTWDKKISEILNLYSQLIQTGSGSQLTDTG